MTQPNRALSNTVQPLGHNSAYHSVNGVVNSHGRQAGENGSNNTSHASTVVTATISDDNLSVTMASSLTTLASTGEALQNIHPARVNVPNVSREQPTLTLLATAPVPTNLGHSSQARDDPETQERWALEWSALSSETPNLSRHPGTPIPIEDDVYVEEVQLNIVDLGRRLTSALADGRTRNTQENGFPIESGHTEDEVRNRRDLGRSGLLRRANTEDTRAFFNEFSDSDREANAD
jgi:hypothetical protein